MTGSTDPTNSNSSMNPTDAAVAATSANYVPQYKVSPEMQKFWAQLFHGPVSEQQAQQLTDGFVKNICDRMNHVMNWALKQQKERNAKYREQMEGKD